MGSPLAHDRLLPCPFCNRQMIYVPEPVVPHFVHPRRVMCVLSGLEVYSDDYKHWNTRAALQSAMPGANNE